MVFDTIPKHEIGGGEHGSGDGQNGLLPAAPTREAWELRPQVAVLPVRGGPGEFVDVAPTHATMHCSPSVSSSASTTLASPSRAQLHDHARSSDDGSHLRARCAPAGSELPGRASTRCVPETMSNELRIDVNSRYFMARGTAA
jgi:hypothetical protein